MRRHAEVLPTPPFSRDATRSAVFLRIAIFRWECPIRWEPIHFAEQMIIGYHVIFSTYGFWLPNDPRGSWSEFVGSWELFRHGRATKVAVTRSVAHRRHDQT